LLSVLTNGAAQAAQNQLARSSAAHAQHMQRLSSGMRINSAADDAAGLGIATAMNAQVRSLSAADRNIQDAVSMLAVVESSATQQLDLLTRMREIAVTASNGSLGAADRQALDGEFQKLADAWEGLGTSTNYNGITLLATTKDLTFQVGTGGDATSQMTIHFEAQVGLTTYPPRGYVRVNNVTDAQFAIEDIDTISQGIRTNLAYYGGVQNRLNSASQIVTTMRTAISESYSRIRDADVAVETAGLAKQKVLTEAGSAILSQANQTTSLVMTLMRG